MANKRFDVDSYIGKKFGKRTVLVDMGKNKYGHTIVKCRCECGEEAVLSLSNLIFGRHQQCKKCRAKASEIHGLCKKHPLYAIWRGIIQRCYYSKDKAYKWYGGRGIIVCERWRHDFKAFYDWAIANGYRKGLTIDRINSNGNYEPNNCRWVNMHIQNVNKRVRITNTSGYTGIHKENNHWLARIGINYKRILIGSFTTKKEAVEARNKYIIDNNLTEYKIQEWKDN